MHIPEYAKQNIEVFDEPDLPQEVMDEIRFKHRWIRNFYGPKVFQ